MLFPPILFFHFSRSFAIQAQMAPTSNLLVYYIPESGEIIGDTISFNVRLQHEKVSITVYVDKQAREYFLGKKCAVKRSFICYVMPTSESDSAMRDHVGCA